MVNSITVKAPSSTANLGPGFDVFGLALDAFFDEIKLSKKKQNGISIISEDKIPTNPTKNTAGIVIKTMQKKFKTKEGLEIKIKKGIPAGYGMGSSAASAAAAAVAFDKLYKLNLDQNSLVKFAGEGEKASAGSVHYDNVAASVLGGFVIVRTNPFDVIQINAPKNLVLCVAIPKIAIPVKKTKSSRSVIPKKIKISDSIQNLSNATAMVVGFLRNNPEIIGSSVNDVIIEPARKHMIPGFNHVKNNTLAAGALGVTISGAGPSVIAFAKKSSDQKKICLAMEKGFKKAKVDCQTIICKPTNGARIIKK
ncbi:MAG TPA: homoserine kinase [Nitrosopumilaceae archaeon]|nr:homoserine kinase [Nitrosopumilaceae archaeon]